MIAGQFSPISPAFVRGKSSQARWHMLQFEYQSAQQQWLQWEQYKSSIASSMVPLFSPGAKVDPVMPPLPPSANAPALRMPPLPAEDDCARGPHPNPASRPPSFEGIPFIKQAPLPAQLPLPGMPPLPPDPPASKLAIGMPPLPPSDPVICMRLEPRRRDANGSRAVYNMDVKLDHWEGDPDSFEELSELPYSTLKDECVVCAALGLEGERPTHSLGPCGHICVCRSCADTCYRWPSSVL